MKALLRLGTFKYDRYMSEDKSVISDEAVEAAARAWVSRHAQPGNWTLEENLLAALKAAAPYILKDADASNILFGAWDAGYHAHMSDGHDYQTPNPYRSES